MKLCCGSAGVAKNRNANCHRKWSGKEFGRLRRSRLRASRLVGPPASPILFDVGTPHHSDAHLRRVSRFATARFLFAPIHTCIDGGTFSHACVVAIQFVRFPNATFPRGPRAKMGRCSGHVFRHVVHVSPSSVRHPACESQLLERAAQRQHTSNRRIREWRRSRRRRIRRRSSGRWR